MNPQERYAFGTFVLDVTDRRLSHDGEAVSLPPKTFDVLVMLVRNADRLLTKRELLESIWPDTFVEEGILTVHISSLRKLLASSGSRVVIETVPRSGYRFTAAVAQLSPPRADLSLQWPVAVLPANPEVYELIGQGRAHLLTISRRAIPQAITAFESAIALDATYAAAHAGLALACCAQAELRLAPHAQAFEHARVAALRALAMDSSSADAQVALGSVLFLNDWNWTGARRSFDRALAIDTSHTEGYLLYGRLLEALGEGAQALAIKQKALEHHPFSARVHLQIANSYWNQRRYDCVIEWASKALELDSAHLLAREYIAGAYLMKGDEDRHMAESIALAEAAGAPAALCDEILQRYAREGRRGVVKFAIDHASQNDGPPLQLAVLHGELGEMDDAFCYLDGAIEGRDPCLVDLAVAPQWDPLRADPRFPDRLARLGLSHHAVR